MDETQVKGRVMGNKKGEGLVIEGLLKSIFVESIRSGFVRFSLYEDVLQ